MTRIINTCACPRDNISVDTYSGDGSNLPISSNASSGIVYLPQTKHPMEKQPYFTNKNIAYWIIDAFHSSHSLYYNLSKGIYITILHIIINHIRYYIVYAYGLTTSEAWLVLALSWTRQTPLWTERIATTLHWHIELCFLWHLIWISMCLTLVMVAGHLTPALPTKLRKSP